MSKKDKQEYDGVYYGNRKQEGAEYLFGGNLRREDFMTEGIRGKGGSYTYGGEPEFDSEAFARAAAASAATGSWMKNIKTDDNASRKAAEPMSKLAEAGLSFEEIDSIMKRTGQKVLDSDNDVKTVLDEYDRMHGLGKYKDGGGNKDKKLNEGPFKAVDYSEDEEYQAAKSRIDNDRDAYFERVQNLQVSDPVQEEAKAERSKDRVLPDSYYQDDPDGFLNDFKLNLMGGNYKKKSRFDPSISASGAASALVSI